MEGKTNKGDYDLNSAITFLLLAWVSDQLLLLLSIRNGELRIRNKESRQRKSIVGPGLGCKHGGTQRIGQRDGRGCWQLHCSTPF